MDALIVIGGVIGWLLIGVLVNWLIDYLFEFLNKDSPIEGDDVAVLVTVLIWPVVVIVAAAIGVAALILLLVSLRPGRRREHTG